MPKPTNKYDRKHLLNLQKLQRKIDDIYKSATKEAAKIGKSILNINHDKPFAFDDYPTTRKRIDSLMKEFQSEVETCIVDGVRSEWTLANNKNSELANRVFGDNVGKLTKEQYSRYFTSNEPALEAFLTRKEGGLSLSDRVWRYTDGFKSEIEMGLDLGLRAGKPADEMARDLQQYLKHPDMLFRRVRDEHGMLHLSKKAAQFHPGRGVYRSSYMNARRLAATEGNIAYRTADHERWQKMDFVVGIEIHLSNNHTCIGSDGKAHEFYDMCDELQGKYPKDFKFTGWHPHCRCYATTILKTDEEIAADTKKILNGEPVDGKSVNEVKDVPEAFKKWLANNEERAAKSYSVPYFLRDNTKYVPKELINAYASRMPYDTYAEYEEAMRYNRKHAHFSEPIRKNIAELNQTLPVVQGKVMDRTTADSGNVNPYYDKNHKTKEHNFNCGTCVPAYLLRRRGYDVIAGEYIDNEENKNVVYDISKNGLLPWLRSDETEIRLFDSEVIHQARWEMRQGDGVDTGIISFVRDNTKEEGVYMVRLGWKTEYGGGSHFTVVERDRKGNLIFYDPQKGENGWDKSWAELINPTLCWLMRVDDKLVNPAVSAAFTRRR